MHSEDVHSPADDDGSGCISVHEFLALEPLVWRSCTAVCTATEPAETPADSNLSPLRSVRPLITSVPVAGTISGDPTRSWSPVLNNRVRGGQSITVVRGKAPITEACFSGNSAPVAEWCISAPVTEGSISAAPTVRLPFFFAASASRPRSRRWRAGFAARGAVGRTILGTTYFEIISDTFTPGNVRSVTPPVTQTQGSTGVVAAWAVRLDTGAMDEFDAAAATKPMEGLQISSLNSRKAAPQNNSSMPGTPASSSLVKGLSTNRDVRHDQQLQSATSFRQTPRHDHSQLRRTHTQRRLK
eukprot:gene4958-6572_t